jgi:hypothetical protein
MFIDRFVFMSDSASLRLFDYNRSAIEIFVCNTSWDVMEDWSSWQNAKLTNMKFKNIGRWNYLANFAFRPAPENGFALQRPHQTQPKPQTIVCESSPTAPEDVLQTSRWGSYFVLTPITPSLCPTLASLVFIIHLITLLVEGVTNSVIAKDQDIALVTLATHVYGPSLGNLNPIAFVRSSLACPELGKE